MDDGTPTRALYRSMKKMDSLFELRRSRPPGPCRSRMRTW